MRIAQASIVKRRSLGPADVALPQWLIALAYVLLTAIALYPVFSVDVLPLVDYPAHLARLHVLTAVDDVPLLAERYAVDWNILPNLAMDVVVMVLADWLPVADALRLFVAVSLVMIVCGCVAVHRALFGGVGVVPGAAFLLLYNHVLIFGFVNYLFGVGLYLLVFAAWIAARRWPAWCRVLLFSVASVALFFVHLFAFGIYGLSVCAYELWHTMRSRAQPRPAAVRSWSVALAQFSIPVALWAASPTGGRNTYIAYGEFKDKLLALFSPVWAYGELIDQVIFVFVGILLVRGLFGGALRIAPELRYPLLALLLAAIVMPSWLLGVWGVDFRLPLVLACLVAAGSRVELPDARIGAAVVAAGLVLVGARIWTISESWRGYDAQYSEFRHASEAIDPGARLLVVQDVRDEGFSTAYWHVAALAVIDRSVFLPTLFTDRTAQPVHATAAYEAIDTPFGSPITPELLRIGADPDKAARLAGARLPTGERIYWANWPKNFDFLLYVHFGTGENPMPERLRRVHAGSFFDIYRIVRD